jgi:hypothetical protein
MAWLFEHAEPDPNVHLPAGEVTFSANGKVYVSAGCPIDYPFGPQASTLNQRVRAVVEAPDAAVRRTTSDPGAGASTSVPQRKHARLVWVPLFLLVALAGSVLGYRNLIAPVLTTSETTAARPEGESRTVIAVEQETRIERELDAGTPEAASVAEAEEPVLSEEEPVASEDELAVPASAAAASTRPRALPERRAPASRPTFSEKKMAASERRSMRRSDAGSRLPPRSSEPVPPLQAPPSRAPTVAVAPTAKVPSPAPADPPTAIGGTPGDGAETAQPVAKEQAAPPAIVRDAQRLPPIARKEQPAPAPAMQRQRQQLAVQNTWLTRMRAELVRCGKPGFFRNDVCREVTRWKYCHPDRWHTVAECGVASFP